MRLKYYLRGAGLGIIVATLLMMIAIAKKGGIFSEEKAIQYALANGYVLNTASADAGISGAEAEDSGQSNLSKEEQDALNAMAEKADHILENKDTEEDKDIAQDRNGSASAEDTASGNAKKGEAVTITVTSRDGSELVSAKLEEAGLVPNASEYNKYLMENKYDKVIHTGSFEIPMGSTYEEIAKIITGRS